MSATIALFLMQASATDTKVYHNAAGFSVISSNSSCFLSTEYVFGVETYILAKENEIYFTLKKSDWKPVSGKRYKFKIEFSEEYYDITTIAMENGNFLTSLHADFLESYAKSRRLDVSWGSKPIASLNLSGSSKAIAALRLCMHDLGINPTTPPIQSAPLAAPAVDPFDRSEVARIRYYGENIYPREANGAEGIVRVAVKVGLNGRAFDCKVIKTSGNTILDSTACKGLQRSSFYVARDRAGQPIESVMETTVRFEDPAKTVEPD